MAKKEDPKNSVQDEQFSKNTEDLKDSETNAEKNTEHSENSTDEQTGDSETVSGDDGKAVSKPETDAEKKSESSGEKPKSKKDTKDSETKEDEKVADDGENSSSEADKKKVKSDKKEKKSEKSTSTSDKPSEKEPQKESINYSLLSKEDLAKLLEEMINDKTVAEVRDEVEQAKAAFYKKHKENVEDVKKKFIDDGGNIEDFKPAEDPLEVRVRDLLKKFRNLKVEFSKTMESEKEENLTKKYAIIEEIKELVNKDESINKTFQEFRDIQNRWYEIGMVPQKNLKHLWETYHYHVEKFYDYIKINKELRDLDLKKNMEMKIELCEKTEALLIEPNIVNAFKTLQKFHEQWREIGPVLKEHREELWERFKEATRKINKKHQEFYQNIRETQKKNLESKTVLCEKVEQLNEISIDTHEEWKKRTREILELQKVWRTIGYAPKKDNNKIYKRFRDACDAFFDNKRDFYQTNLEDQKENLKKKIELCEKAESLQESTDWKKTTSELIHLQKKWKTIGPAPREDSDAVWKRFRAACDIFFNRKQDYFSNIDSRYEENLAEKRKIIDEINKFQPGENNKENLKALNEFQRRWSKIGFVPFKNKDEIMQQFREAINKHYDSLEMDENRKLLLKFRNKLDTIKSKPKFDIKLQFEREKLMTKLQQLKTDIGVWENNIGFFADSDKAESMVADFKKKIEDAHEKIELLEEKVMMIDEMDEE